GSAEPLSGSRVHATHVHGEDGLGGWTARGRVALGRLSEHSASELIVRLARQSPGEITLLLIGPATNAALALRDDPAGFRALARIVMMGGAVFEPGNVTSTAEFNVYADPEAAKEVISSGVTLTMVGLDVTRRVSLTREVLEGELGGRRDARAEFLRCVARQGFSFYKNISGWEGFYLHDPLAAAVALDRSLVQCRRMKVDIETTGELTRGMTVAERRPWIQGGENAEVCVEVDAAKFLGLFTEPVLRG
ncbi:MAG: nucleoside hydrolase, partial [Acidobacteriaceae bacterium]|nr:nucleoside hydrolase [Acidobacteriaceae bacterium]